MIPVHISREDLEAYIQKTLVVLEEILHGNLSFENMMEDK